MNHTLRMARSYESRRTSIDGKMKTTWNKVTLHTDNGEIVTARAPVIISASRSTDIPAFHADWFMNRFHKGYVIRINPFNRKPLYISFEHTRAIVFWSKNPRPMMKYLDELDSTGVNYYFLFTVNDYDANGLEPHVPPLEQRIETFTSLSERLGPDRVIWRFDPLILTDNIDIAHLLEKIERIGDKLYSLTRKLVFSFVAVDVYRKVQNNLRRSGIRHREFTDADIQEFVARLTKFNEKWGLDLSTCGERVDLARWNVSHNRCIDDRLLIKLFRKDRK